MRVNAAWGLLTHNVTQAVKKKNIRGGMCIIIWTSGGIFTVKQAVSDIFIELRAVFPSIL